MLSESLESLAFVAFVAFVGYVVDILLAFVAFVAFVGVRRREGPPECVGNRDISVVGNYSRVNH
jgi:hypothetical protein